MDLVPRNSVERSPLQSCIYTVDIKPIIGGPIHHSHYTKPINLTTVHLSCDCLLILKLNIITRNTNELDRKGNVAGFIKSAYYIHNVPTVRLGRVVL